MSPNLKALIKRWCVAAASGRTAWLGAGSFALSLASAASPGSAYACSGIACFPGRFFLAPEAVVPANIVALRWRPTNDINANAVPPVPHVTRIDGTPEEQLIEIEDVKPNGENVVRIVNGFVPGARYRLWVEGEDDEECRQAPIEIVAGPKAPLPEQLGRTVVGDPMQGDVTVPHHGSECDTQIPAVSVGVDLELAAEAEPWAALLMFTVRVDAMPWSYVPSYYNWPPLLAPGIVAPEPANTTVFAQCPGEREDGLPLSSTAEPPSDLEPGTHQVVIEASLPGVVTMLYTDPVEIVLECEPAAEPDSGTMDDGDDAGADAASSARDDAGEGDNGGSNSGAARRASNSGSCAVHANGARRDAEASLGWLLCALTLLPLRARLRRRITG